MPNPESIVREDAQITQILTTNGANAVSALFEYYRIHRSDDFVAALVGRLCMLHAQSLLKQSQTWLRDGVGA